MQEYSSINVSSYEAASLADRLTKESKDGWEVVAVVPTGSTITAYLSRSANGTSDDTASATAAAVSAPTAIVEDVAGTIDASTVEDVAVEPEANVAEPAPADHLADEAAGWAVSPEAPSDATESLGGGQEVSAAVADVAPTLPTVQAATASVQDPVPASVPAGETPAAEPQAAGAAPAGWYADPSARFELRYWDAAQWTEHVSRAGQQYTDPPVA